GRGGGDGAGVGGGRGRVGGGGGGGACGRTGGGDGQRHGEADGQRRRPERGLVSHGGCSFHVPGRAGHVEVLVGALRGAAARPAGVGWGAPPDGLAAVDPLLSTESIIPVRIGYSIRGGL